MIRREPEQDMPMTANERIVEPLARKSVPAEEVDSFYRDFLKPLLFQLDAERAHELAVRLAPYLAPVLGREDPFDFDNARLIETSFAGISLKSPIGLAAGFDKNGRLTDVTGQLGFGFHEVGSLTGRASPGNAKPRVFRLPQDFAVVNRLGLNGDGAKEVAERLSRARFALPVGVNIAKTNHPSIKGDAAIEDVLCSFNCIKGLPIAYVTINASCPNTHEGIIEEKREIGLMLKEVQTANSSGLPVLLKLSPDSSDELLDDFINVSIEHGISGFVCGNTTVSRDSLRTPQAIVTSIGNGGLSGRPLKAKAIDLCRRVHSRKEKNQVIIGCGGIFSAADVYQFLRAGASCVALYTGLIYGGPRLPILMNRALAKMFAHDGTDAKGVVGADL